MTTTYLNRSLNLEGEGGSVTNIKGFTLGVAIVVVLFTYTVLLATYALVRLEPYTVYIDLSFPLSFVFSFFSLQIESST